MLIFAKLWVTIRKEDYFVKSEPIKRKSDVMVVLDVRLDNFYAFQNFHMNLTYPKKIVGSSIKDEHLPDRPNFRYKKVNIIMGANASGKTTLGHMFRSIFNFIVKNQDYIVLVFFNLNLFFYLLYIVAFLYFHHKFFQYILQASIVKSISSWCYIIPFEYIWQNRIN